MANLWARKGVKAMERQRGSPKSRKGISGDDDVGASRSIKEDRQGKREVEGRTPPPPLDYFFLPTLKRAHPSCGRATREELPPSPAREG